MKFNWELAIAAFAEFCGTAMMISLGCLGTYKNTLAQSDNLLRGMTWGFAVLMATQSFAGLSGAHLTPCVTIAAMIMKVVDITTGIIYIVMQVFGSFFGFGIAYGLAPNKGNFFCCTVLGPGIAAYKGVIIEFVITAVWIFVMLAGWHPSNENVVESLSLRIGLGVAGCNVACAFFTGASMNPFRSLPPAIVANRYKDIWIYLIVPPITAALIALLWRFVYVKGLEESPPEE